MLEKLDTLHILTSLFYGRVRDYKTHHNFLKTYNNSKIQVPKTLNKKTNYKFPKS